MRYAWAGIDPDQSQISASVCLASVTAVSLTTYQTWRPLEVCFSLSNVLFLGERAHVLNCCVVSSAAVGKKLEEKLADEFNVLTRKPYAEQVCVSAPSVAL